ncbi:metalloregulator ArsR/SmtB family transcription factor [Pseudofrankia sp. DC12]|uniref:ArsR/SmtB family transcription factor n=1 Tax=Pseudofrankia sp. DC12 TaxID=683315 RepID=UPI0005F8724A|nr:metalloregulator ArsR/SmtB family transcription factor [Pseudofrankia sp. DC12]
MSEPAPEASLDETLSALADPVRRRAVELLAAGPRRAGELASALGATPSTMSKHLRVLRQCGLVSETHPEFDARVRIYTLRSVPMTELRRWIDTAEQAWAGQLAAFAAHLERHLER